MILVAFCPKTCFNVCMADEENIDLDETGLGDLTPEDMVDGINDLDLEEEEDDDDDPSLEEMAEDSGEFYDNFPLEGDDDVGELAEDMGVIKGENEEEQEVDITRVPWQSNISNSPAPDSNDFDEEPTEDELDEIEEMEMEDELEEGA